MTDALERLDAESCADRLQVALHNQRYDFVLQQLPPVESILEIGTGLGVLSPRLAARCHRYTGIEFDAQTCALANQRLGGTGRILQGDARNLPLESRSFAAAVCLEVLEHLGDFKAGVREIHRCLSPDGLALISVPYRKHGGVNPTNLYHLYEPGEGELVACLAERFKEVQVRYQHFAETPWMTAARVLRLRRLFRLDGRYSALTAGQPEAVSQLRIDAEGAGMRLHLVVVAKGPRG